MFRRSANRVETRTSLTRSEGFAVSEQHPSPVTPNISDSPSSDTHHLISNVNGVCATQPHASIVRSSPPCTTSSKRIQSQVSTPESVRHVLEMIETNLLRYPCDPGCLAGLPVHNRAQPIRVNASDCKRVCCQYFSLCEKFEDILKSDIHLAATFGKYDISFDIINSISIPDKVKASLGSHTFNNWLHSDAELIHYLKFMFLDLNLPQLCRFPIETLDSWLLAIYRRYNDVPFHNFKHAFMVTQMMYSMIKQANLVSCLAPLDLLVLLFSALSHDLDHPGFTNSYQINRRSWLALRYNDISPLENHHCAVAFDLISIPSTNILVGLTPIEYQWFRKAVIRCILATDMAFHKDCVDQFRTILPQLVPHSNPSSSSTDGRGSTETVDVPPLDGMEQLRIKLNSDPNCRLTVLLMLLKTCDISNEVRPSTVADPWLDCLLDEFFTQAKSEKLLGLPVMPHMDPDKVTRAGSQIGFIQNLLIPLLRDLTKLFPRLKCLESSAQERILYFERKQRESEEASEGQKTVDPVSSQLVLTNPPSQVGGDEVVRSAQLHLSETQWLPRTDPVSLRTGKLRCLSTPVRPEFPAYADGTDIAHFLPEHSSVAGTSRERPSRYSTGAMCGNHSLFTTRDATGSKRHHSQQHQPTCSALFPKDFTQHEPPTKRDAEPLPSDSAIVATAAGSQSASSATAIPTVVSRKSSTGSMVAALN